MAEGKTVKDLMVPIGEYDKMDVEARLCDALGLLKRKYENAKSGAPSRFHKTIFVIEPSGKIIGKIAMYDLIRGLVPESSMHLELPRRIPHVPSSRIWEIEERTAELTERLGWLTHGFVDLVKQEAHKKIKDIMTPVHPILKEEDTINQAIYLMFKENVRQPLVVQKGEVVGVIDLMRVFSELLEIAGPECHVHWES
jgi:CBS domain-containing protein